jgi:hypothetical protein
MQMKLSAIRHYRRQFLGLAAGCLTTVSLPFSVHASEPVKLFNGKDLSGWHGWDIHKRGGSPADIAKLDANAKKQKLDEYTADAAKHWSVKEDVLINDGNGAFLATDKEYGDIILELEYKTIAKADSGIYLRACPQVQIWDTTDPTKFNLGADKGSGGLWNNSKDAPGKDPLVKADKPFGEWNKVKVIQVGERTTVYLNDQLVVDHARMENYWNRKEPIPAKGAILLQTHGGEICWRNITVQELTAEEANAILEKKNVRGFTSIFNGKDLTGWAGPVENYEVKDGTVVCKANKGGTIHTADDYQNFAVRAMFQLPSGGNNGFAIRYPGKGDTAYEGMCEIQVLDDTSDKYTKLDARQFNGSAYGMAASHRGYLRPVGQWNFEEITVVGSKITVELNGTRILDTDLSAVKEFMGKTPHTGKDRTQGSFGLAGHNDPVAFKALMIKKLD